MAIVRLEFIRTIVFQGDEQWVLKSAQRQINGTLQCGPDRFVIASTLAVYKSTPENAIKSTVRRETVEEREINDVQ